MATAPKTIVAIGEALWDEFPDGRRPGGAPCNVAFHAARLGNHGVIISRVGADPPGTELIAFLRDRGVDTRFMQRDEMRPTGTVRVAIDDAGPRYAITEDVAWDFIAADEAPRTLVADADAMCVGSLAQRGVVSRATIQELLARAKGRALIVFDVNLRPPFEDAAVIDTTCRFADVVKLSEDELARLSSLLGRDALVDWLLHDVGATAVCVTRGRDGATLVTRDGTVAERGIAADTSVGDPVGAGDAFTAALTHQLVRRASPAAALQVANRYAALVASRRGAMPTMGG